MKRIFTILVSLLFAFNANAQRKLDYNHSKWFFGVNVGAAWHTTDVKNKTDYGWGLILGKSFNYNYGTALSFDLRGRFLTGNYYGQNHSATSDLSGNALYKPYADSMGLGVLNFKSNLYRGALELVIHANRFRERTGWDLFIFGGAGVSFYKTTGNLTKSNLGTEELYAYNQLVTIDKASVTGLVDGSYETNLNGSSAYKTAFAPSLGFGIGRQVSKRLYFGLEHKTTFTMADDFDGFAAGSGDKKNDMYHYTSAYLRWYFKTRTHTDPEIVKPIDPITTNAINLPIVNFTNPSQSGTTVSNPDFIIRADVLNVSDRQNIVFKQNGNYISSYAFNSVTGKLESNVYLVLGQNVFDIVASNANGTDQESTIVIYNQVQQIAPPRVDITNPAISPATVNNSAFNFTANVFNVNNQSEITLQLNGVVVPFNWNPSTSQVTSNFNLNLGSNVVVISASNVAGSDSESATIIYRPTEQLVKPVVVFTDPSLNPYTTALATHAITANVFNVASAQNITFKQNGQVSTNFTYNVTTHVLATTVNLNPGQNIFEIIATNNAGLATASTVIIYTRPAPKPPIVTITNPSTSPVSVNNSNYTLAATVLNVAASNQVVVTLNGAVVSGFTFTAATNGVIAQLNLIVGANIITVKGTNADGTDIKTTTIIYQPSQVAQPPVVTYLAPASSPITVENPNFTVSGTISNLTLQSQANVNVNGSNVTNFTYNLVNHTFSIPLVLIEGVNVIVTTGTNLVGVDSETISIIYRKPNAPINPPIVSFIVPAVNPADSYTQNYNLTARVSYVAGASNIVLKINGVATTNFTYVLSSEMMNFSSGLVQGANIFEITATNASGQDVESTTIIYHQPVQTLAPTVNIINPATSPLLVSTATSDVQAVVLNVASSNEISVTLNGAPFTNFTFNATTHIVSFSANLVQGSNLVVITATNNGGTATDNTTIIYKPVVVIVPPTVVFITPAISGTTVLMPGYLVRAKVLNVDNKLQITFSKDGQQLNQADFSYNPATKEVSINTNLILGNNTFIVTGTNAAGTVSANTSITYQAQVVPCAFPTVAIISPVATLGEVLESELPVIAQVLNLTGASQLQVTLNGAVLTNGINFNPATGAVNFNVTLAEGQNIIELTATNDCKTVKSNVKVTYRKVVVPCFSPTIQRITPLENITVETGTYNYKAVVANLASSSQATLTMNNAVVPFNYDVATGIITATLGLNNGDNNVNLQASNACGSVSNAVVILYRACVPPTLTLGSIPEAGITTTTSVSITGNIGGTYEGLQVSATLNGRPVNFVYNEATHMITLNYGIAVGVNTFVVVLMNACGTVTQSITFTRENVVQVIAPTVNITSPTQANSATTVETSFITATTTQITSQSQVSVTVNGNPTNFNFNAATNEIGFNATLQLGGNAVVVTVANSAGNASDSRIINYSLPVIPLGKPVIIYTAPSSNPTFVPAGVFIVVGYVENITNINQVEIKVNGTTITNFSPTLSNNVMTFTFPVSVDASNPSAAVQIHADNGYGVDNETRMIHAETPSGGNGNGGNGNNGNGKSTNINNTQAPIKANPATKPVVKPVVTPAQPVVKPAVKPAISPAGRTEAKPVTDTVSTKPAIKPAATTPLKVGGRGGIN